MGSEALTGPRSFWALAWGLTLPLRVNELAVVDGGDDARRGGTAEAEVCARTEVKMNGAG